MLEKWRTRAVAKEAELVARKKRQCEELKMCVQQRIQAKNLSNSTSKVSTYPQHYLSLCRIFYTGTWYNEHFCDRVLYTELFGVLNYPSIFL